jgi:hypothetical protein
VLLWAVVAPVAAVLAALGTVAALAGREKPLLIFAVLFGIVCGLGLGELAKRLSLVPVRRAVVVLTLAALVIGQAAMALESHRRYAAGLRAQYAHDPAAVVASRLRAQGDLHTDAYAAFAAGAKERRELLEQRASFAGYLHARVPKRLGDWPPPWPAVLWGFEVLAASLLGTWMFSRRLQSVERTTSLPLS